MRSVHKNGLLIDSSDDSWSLAMCRCLSSTGDSGKVTTVVATPGQGPDRPQEVSYTDIKVIGNGSFGVVYQARLIDSHEMVAIKKVLQDKRFKVCKTDSITQKQKRTLNVHRRLWMSLNSEGWCSWSEEVRAWVYLLCIHCGLKSDILQ